MSFNVRSKANTFHMLKNTAIPARGSLKKPSTANLDKDESDFKCRVSQNSPLKQVEAAADDEGPFHTIPHWEMPKEEIVMEVCESDAKQSSFSSSSMSAMSSLKEK